MVELDGSGYLIQEGMTDAFNLTSAIRLVEILNAKRIAMMYRLFEFVEEVCLNKVKLKLSMFLFCEIHS